jgi:hypothetical protein
VIVAVIVAVISQRIDKGSTLDFWQFAGAQCKLAGQPHRLRRPPAASN